MTVGKSGWPRARNRLPTSPCRDTSRVWIRLSTPACLWTTTGRPTYTKAGGGTCKGGRLKDNMMEIDGTMQSMEGLVDFHEATWVHKYNGKYYLSYSDNHNPGQEGVEGYNRMRYAVSDHPLGPWKYMGIYMGGSDCFTNHGSIVEYKGEWFAFYHSIALSGNPALRSVCVDRLYYNPDGTIRMVERRK